MAQSPLELAQWMTREPSSWWVLESIHRKLSGGTFRQPLEDYHPLTLNAVLNHLDDVLNNTGTAHTYEHAMLTGDPEIDALERAIEAGIDPTTLPQW